MNGKKLDRELMTGKTALVGLGPVRGPCKPDRNILTWP